MITGATHALSPDLMASGQNFKTQIEEQRNMYAKPQAQAPEGTAPAQGTAPTEGTAPLEGTAPAEPIEAPQEAEETTIDYDAIEADMNSRRDSARQNAVLATGITHQQDMVDTYINASSDGDDDEQNDYVTMEIDPADAYQTSMDYSRNMALIEAFESVGSEKSNQSHVSVLA